MHSHSENNGDKHNNSEGNKKLAVVSVFNIVGFFVELVGGLTFGSVALVSDAIHMLFDALAYVMAFMASFIAKKYDDEKGWSYGVHRVEPLVAFINGILLIPMVGYILWESYQRFLVPIEIGTGPTLAIAFGGLLVNIISVYILNGDDMSLNERGAFYHLIGDAGGSVAVILSTTIIYFTGIKAVDPIVASLISMFIIWSAIKVLVGSSSIFLHRSPTDVDKVKSNVTKVEGVSEVDDIHIWQICSQIRVATIHININEKSSNSTNEIMHKTHNKLSDFGIDHATVEICRGCSNNKAHLGEHSH